MIVTWLSCNKLHKTDRERNSKKDEWLKNSNVTFPQMSSEYNRLGSFRWEIVDNTPQRHIKK